MKKPTYIVFFLLLTSCAQISTLTKSDNKKPANLKSLTSSKNHIAAVKENEKFLSAPKKISPKKSIPEQEVTTIFSAQLKTDATTKSNRLPLRYKKKHYDFWVKYFSKKQKARFLRHMSNGLKFEKIVEDVFKEHGLPADLFFVGLIESGFNTHIRSHASAVGPWQFIKGTGKRYGLKIDRYLDERRNIYKSSHAAANYFKDLYNIFGSWELALCAYNAGEYRIINAIRRGNTRDYRELVRMKLIPKETMFYIPKVAAARYLFKNRKKYGLNPKRVNNSIYLNVDKVVAKSSFSLNDVAKKIGVKRATLRTLNPEVKESWVGVTRRRPMHLLVPKGFERRFSALKISKKYRSVASQKIQRIKQTIHQRVSSVYKVKRGDNLTHIARKFGLPVKKIKHANKLRSSKIRIGQKLIIPGTGSKYTVRKGDNLTRIARKFKVSIQSIVSANGIKNHEIYKGQKLIILASARQ